MRLFIAEVSVTHERDGTFAKHNFHVSIEGLNGLALGCDFLYSLLFRGEGRCLRGGLGDLCRWATWAVRSAAAG